MNARFFLVVLALLGLALPAAARSKKRSSEPKSTPELLSAARNHMADLDFDKAAPLLKKAVKDPNLAPAERARAFVDLGICDANLNQEEDAKAAFFQALDADPKVELPPHTSPKIVQLFESQRSQAAQAKVETEKKPEPEKKPEEKKPEVAQAEPEKKPAPVAQVESRPAKSSEAAVQKTAEEPSLAVPAVCAGVGAAGLVAGIYFGLRSSGAASDLSKGVANRATADDLLSRQHSSATFSAIGYGVAVAGVAAAAGFYFLGGDSGSSPSAALVPLPGGGAVAVSGILRWPGEREAREFR